MYLTVGKKNLVWLIKKKHLLNFSTNFTLELTINSENKPRIMSTDKDVGSVVANKEHPKIYRKHAEKMNHTNLRTCYLQKLLKHNANSLSVQSSQRT